MKKIIRIHTMLNRTKLYIATNVEVNTTSLIITGKNMTTGFEGNFSYPFVNIEHYNYFEVADDYNLNLIK